MSTRRRMSMDIGSVAPDGRSVAVRVDQMETAFVFISAPAAAVILFERANKDRNGDEFWAQMGGGEFSLSAGNHCLPVGTVLQIATNNTTERTAEKITPGTFRVGQQGGTSSVGVKVELARSLV